MQIEAIFSVPSSTLVLGGMYDPRHFRRQKTTAAEENTRSFELQSVPTFFFFFLSPAVQSNMSVRAEMEVEHHGVSLHSSDSE